MASFTPVAAIVTSASRDPVRVWHFGQQRSQAVDTGVADLVNGSPVDSLGKQIARRRGAGCEMDARVAGDAPPKPFLGKWIGNSIGAQACLDVGKYVGGVVRGPRAAVCGQRVALHDDHRRPDSLQNRAQLGSQVVV